MVDRLPTRFLYCEVLIRYGQVAQLVERGPEKAGVGGSIPSLATIIFKHLAIVKTCEKFTSREQYANIGYFRFHFWRRSFEQPRNVLLVLLM